MRETQATIWAWRLATFGPPTILFRIITRANEEMAELLRKVAVGTHAPAEIAEEAADVAIVLYGAAEMMGIEVGKLPGRAQHVLSAEHCATVANMLLATMLSRITQYFLLTGDLVRRAFEDLASLCQAIELDLGDAIDAKMAINRAREWKLDGTGHGYHVREKAGA